MSDKIIIHLSDLHVSTHKDEYGEPKKGLGSFLSTEIESDLNKRYVTSFIEYILSKYESKTFYLIVSGDLADCASKEEYDALLLIMERIVSELKIDKDRVLIIPGDHDINRASVGFAYENSDKSQPIYTFHKDKFLFFSKFYSDFFGKPFDYDKVICDILDFKEEKFVLLGMNSNGRIGNRTGLGYIDRDKLKGELKNLEAYQAYSKVAITHHNMLGQYESTIHGQWDEQNKVELLSLLESENINLVLYGNEHTASSNTHNSICFISAAAFAKKGGLNGFRCYVVNNVNQSIFLNNIKFSLQNDGAKTVFEFGSWSEVELNKQSEHVSIAYIRQPAASQKTLEALDITGERSKVTDLTDNILGNDRKLATPSEIKKAVSEKTLLPLRNIAVNDFHKLIFQIVKDNNLFKSGHFHWNDSSKGHNWIDVPSLLSDRQNMFTAQKAIYDVIKKNKIEYDLVISLGMEGNILGSYTALKDGKPYSYLPYSYRYHDHEDYEKDIKLSNKGKYKKVLLITDIVKNGKTVDKLLELEQQFFSEKFVSEISVISLFYTGDPTKEELNPDENSRTKYYYVSNMKVEACPYGIDFRETCMIYREKLACVHEFYDASQNV